MDSPVDAGDVAGIGRSIRLERVDGHSGGTDLTCSSAAHGSAQADAGSHSVRSVASDHNLALGRAEQPEALSCAQSLGAGCQSDRAANLARVEQRVIGADHAVARAHRFPGGACVQRAFRDLVGDSIDDGSTRRSIGGSGQSGGTRGDLADHINTALCSRGL